MKRIISLLLIVMLIMTSCKADNPSNGVNTDNDNNDVQTDDVTEGGKFAKDQVLKFIYSEEATTLNYLVTGTQVDYSIAAKGVSTLVEYDKYGIIKPGLAETWNVSDDGFVWTFNLRKGAMWVDFEGNEIAETTAHDFVAAAKYLLTASNESITANTFYAVIENAKKYFDKEIDDFSLVGVKALDDYTLQYTLSKPVPYFESMLTYVCFLPAYGPLLEEKGEYFGTTNDTLYYNGGFILSEFEPQVKKVFVKNQKYWDKDNIFIEKIDYKYNKEAAAIGAELYKRGEANSVNIPTSSLDEWMNDPELKNSIRPAKKNEFTFFYAFNFKPQFDAEYEPENWKLAVNNLNFRNSIKAAFNRIAAAMTLDPYNPEYRMMNTITPPEFISQNGKDYTMTGDLAEITTNDFYDEAKAKSYKEKAIEELTAQGAKFPVKILMPYNTGSENWAQESQVVKQQLESVLGSDYIQVILYPSAPTGFLDATRRAGNYGLMKVNWGADYADPETYTEPFDDVTGTYNFPGESTAVDENGEHIYTKYKSIIEKAKEEVVDLSKRYEMFAEAEAILINNSFVIPFYCGGGSYMATLEDPFGGPYALFGLSALSYKGEKLLAKSMNMEEFAKAQEEWKIEREKRLAAQNK